MICTAVVMAGSLALTTAVVAHAYYLKHQFYPTVVYLTKSSPSMAVLYIQAFVLVFLLGKFMGKVFFGQLRAAEMEVSDGEERFQFGARDGQICCQGWRRWRC
uniref:E3 ubiquitin-protein ligase synoviolin-like TPR repeats domain-containing protein n=1 Tax=Falco tinnunculus TaxID=100819 RepID=A0A8C4TXG5_FALTI